MGKWEVTKGGLIRLDDPKYCLFEGCQEEAVFDGMCRDCWHHENDSIREGLEECKRDDIQENKKLDRILMRIRKHYGMGFYKALLDYLLQDSWGFLKAPGAPCPIDFVTVPEGEKSKDRVQGREVWINQTCNGGYSGDEFAGYIYIRLSKGNYLRYWYEC